MSVPINEDRWQAVLLRDPEADGRFVYAVHSTGIYCKPTCPSRRPRRDGVSFFDRPDLAEAAGFRPCRRCRPGQPSAADEKVEQARLLIDQIDSAPTLAELGEAVGLSPYHLQRLFKKATGLTPKQYAAHLKAERLKARLREGDSVTDAMLEAGYGSSRALYEQAGAQLGMRPGAYKRGGAGEVIRYARADSPIGPFLLAATAQGICFLHFGEPLELERALEQEYPKATLMQADLAPYIEAVLASLTGAPAQLELPLDLSGTPFQQKVWNALRTIPSGETRTYSQLAAMVGEERAVRAVARACATNKTALLIPCHRVVRSNGELAGYRWGVERKQRLLEQERGNRA